MANRPGINTLRRARFFAVVALPLVFGLMAFLYIRFSGHAIMDNRGQPSLPRILVVGLSPLVPFSAIVLSLWLQQSAVLRRRSAASAKGFTLCSKCEYPIDLRNAEVEPVTCPECGCCLTAAEHAAIEKDWRIWKY